MYRMIWLFLFIVGSFSLAQAGDFSKHDVKEQWLAMVSQTDLAQLRLWRHNRAILCPIHEGKTMRMLQSPITGQSKQPTPIFDNILSDSIVFNPRGERYAFVAERNGQQCVVINGTPGALYSAVVPESVRVLDYIVRFIIREAGEKYRFVDSMQPGQEIKYSSSYDEIRKDSMRIAPNKK